MNKIHFTVESWDHSKDWVKAYLSIKGYDMTITIKRPKYDSWLLHNNKLNIEPMEYNDGLEIKKIPQKVDRKSVV